ncbi:DUF4871 domain-containing protein [Paenibacillus sp. EC2-1]|uniref:DUF4871 domain-containing protein n=1 Tax=Paenibacillus sp. EC2-1 TaxID=3388665 RepID=UPI003BEEB392
MNHLENEKEQDWTKELRTSPFKKPYFTQDMKNDVLDRSSKSTRSAKTRKKSVFRATVAGLGTFAILGMLFIFLPNLLDSQKVQPENEPMTIPGNWTPHVEYLAKDGSPILQVFPGGEFQAGTPAGSWWNLYVPIETLTGESIHITAVHKDTGMQIEELPATTITSDMTYEDFTRVSSTFSLPLSGLWRFDVFIGKEKFGDVVIDVPDSRWEPSPVFRSGNYEMTGVTNRLGFINPGFIAGQPNKYMWHFWGSDADLTGELRITAVEQNSLEIIDVFKTKLHPSKLNGADAAIPTKMSLPTPGLWRLMVSIDGQLFGSVIVTVQ